MNSPWQDTNIVILSNLINESFNRWTNQYLVKPERDPVELAKNLYFAPFVVFGVNNHPDPLFNYANQYSQQLFIYNWIDFINLKATIPVEVTDLEQDQRILDECSNHGFSKGFEGIRITSTGKRFKIGRTVLWNVLDESGRKIGKAVVFNKWEFI